MNDFKLEIEKPEAAVLAWLCVLRSGFASRRIAQNLVEQFEAPKAAWEAALSKVAKVHGFEPLIAEARLRFGIVI